MGGNASFIPFSPPKKTHLVGIGMVLLGELEIGLFDFSLVGGSAHTQDVVKVSLGIGRQTATTGAVSRVVVCRRLNSGGSRFCHSRHGNWRGMGQDM